MLKFDPQHCFARGGTEGDNILQDGVHRGSSKGAQMGEVSKGAILRSSGPSSGLIRQISAGLLVNQAERLVEKCGAHDDRRYQINFQIDANRGCTQVRAWLKGRWQ